MKKRIWKIVLIASLILIVISTANIIILSREYQRGINTYANLEKYANVTQASASLATDYDASSGDSSEDNAKGELTAQEEKNSQPSVNLDIDYDALSEINSDFVGWIYYEPLEINYPIVLGNDNDYYTHYTFEKEKNSSGAIFMDFLNKADFSQFNTIIYGHNMRNGTMFGSLKKLLNNNSIIEDDPYIYIFTKEKIMMYEICAAYITDISSQTYDLTQTSEEQESYLKYIQETADYYWDSPMLENTPSEDIHLITLSTCHGLHSQNRTVIHGVLVHQFINS